MTGGDMLMRIDELGFITAKHLVSLSWQFFLLFVAGAAAALVLRKTAARIRYAVWASMFALFPVVALLVVAAGKIGAPQIEVEIIPVYPAIMVTGGDFVSSMPVLDDAPEAIAPIEERTRSLTHYPWAIFFVFYCTGAAGLSGLACFGRCRLYWLKNRGTVVTDRRVRDIFEDARTRLGIIRSISVIESDSLVFPVTVGTVHPVILLPRGFDRRISVSSLRTLALHELAHVKRCDSIKLFVVSLIRAVFFFNPFIWHAVRQVSALAENACDDIVIESEHAPLDYASMLVGLARTIPDRVLAIDLPAGFFVTRHSFLRRVEQILADRRGIVTTLPKWELTGCYVFAAIVVMFIAAFPAVEVSEGVNEPVTAHSREVKTVYQVRLIESEDGGQSLGTLSPSETTKKLTIIMPSMKTSPVKSLITVVLAGYAGSRYSARYDNTRNASLANPGLNSLAVEFAEIMRPVTGKWKQTMTIAGTVYDPDGNPVAGATVVPVMTGGGNSITGDTRYSVKTDRNGHYILYLPPGGEKGYHLVAHDGDYGEFRKWANGVTRAMKTVAGWRVDDFDIVMTRPSSVRGTVVGSDGRPRAGQGVTVTGCDGKSNSYCEPAVLTDRNGRFEITHVRPGENMVVLQNAVQGPMTFEQAPDGVVRKVTVESGRVLDGIKLVTYTRSELNDMAKNERVILK